MKRSTSPSGDKPAAKKTKKTKAKAAPIVSAKELEERRRIHISTINPAVNHNKSHHFIDLKVVSVPDEFRMWATTEDKRTPGLKTGKLMSVSFVDDQGDMIEMTVFNESAEKVMKAGFQLNKCYRFEFMSFDAASARDRQNLPNAKHKIKFTDELKWTKLEEQQEFDRPPVKYSKGGLTQIPQVYDDLGFDDSGYSKGVVDIVGVVLEHTQPELRRGDLLHSKVSVADDTLTRVSFNLWGPTKNKTRYENDQLLSLHDCKIKKNKDSYDILPTAVVLVTPAMIKKSDRLQEMARWSKSMPFTGYTDLSKYGGSGGSGATPIRRVTLADVVEWKAEVLSMLGAGTPLDDKLPKGLFSMVAKITRVAPQPTTRDQLLIVPRPETGNDDKHHLRAMLTLEMQMAKTTTYIYEVYTMLGKTATQFLSETVQIANGSAVEASDDDHIKYNREVQQHLEEELVETGRYFVITFSCRPHDSEGMLLSLRDCRPLDFQAECSQLVDCL